MCSGRRCDGADAGGRRLLPDLWLDHESIETTQTDLHAHLALKEAALARQATYFRSPS